MRILIIGANGFIGNWLVRRLLNTTDWEVVGLDLHQHNLNQAKDGCLAHPRFRFQQVDILQDHGTVEKEIEKSDIIIPLAAIANPKIYVEDPLRVFRLDFEANVQIVKWCHKYKKRLTFPSTSEVYGKCSDLVFDEDNSDLVVGPINKTRWIYSTCKQLLDRVIYAYGEKEGLAYTLFRPFNWMGPRLDDINTTQEGGARAFTQFLSNAINGRDIHLVNGGTQRRAFIYIDDAIEALIKILRNENNVADKEIFNIGNPANDHSIKELAEIILEETKSFPASLQKAQDCSIVLTKSESYFGNQYQDVDKRVPSIIKAQTLLQWAPHTSLREGVKRSLDFYLN